MEIASLHIIDNIIILLTIFLMIGIGVYTLLRRTSSDEYTIADRSLKWPVIGFHVMATYIGVGTLIGGLGSIYFIGASGAWYPLSLGISFIILMIISKRLRILGPMTMGDIFEKRYNRKALRYIYALTTVPTFSGAAAAQLMAFATIGSLILGYNEKALLITFGVIAIGYTIMGGFLAVAYTDM